MSGGKPFNNPDPGGEKKADIRKRPSGMAPYYSDSHVTIYHADARDLSSRQWRSPDILVTDPPYGIAYASGYAGHLPRSIEGDNDTSLRDWALAAWGDRDNRPAIVFGTWKRPRPARTRMVLVWDTKGALGMGDLALPWKPSHQEIYIIGSGFSGRRTSDVLRFAPLQSKAENGRVHPHQKPVDLMQELIQKCPDGIVLDPFMGSGSTLVAAKALHREAIGIEIEERYCEVAARRLSQEVMDFGGAS